MSLPDDVVVHRVGGATIPLLRLKKIERTLPRPGISVLIGGTAAEALADMRAAYPGNAKWATADVASATVGAIRAAGFDVIAAATPTFSNHGRIVHAAGAAGFDDPNNLAILAMAFTTEEVRS
jgi:hypothetical protein